MKIETKEGIDHNYVNKYLSDNFNGLSSYVSDGFYHINGDLTSEQEDQINSFYDGLQPYVFEDDYMVSFLKEKYYINEERGIEYCHEISAKTVMMIENGEISLDEAAINQDKGTKVIDELRKGYWHSAYLAHVSYEPIAKLQSIHEEIRIYLKNYINDKYPPTFHVE